MKLDEMRVRQIYTVNGTEVEDLLNGDFSHARDLYLKTSEALYRGTTGGMNRIVDPRARGPRQNANMISAVNAFIDKDPSWKGFPRRGQSIIMSSSAIDADDYGDVGVVFPINGSRVGCSHKRDFWYVAETNKQQHKLPSLMMLEEVLDKIISGIESFNPNLARTLRDAFFESGRDAYKQAVRANEVLDDILLDDDTEKHLLDWLLTGEWSNHQETSVTAAAKAIRMGWMNYLNLVLNPRHAGITVQRIDDMTKIEDLTEYWTDGKCLLLDQQIWMDYKRDRMK